MREVNDAARELDRKVSRDLWHALLFFNAGLITTNVLSEAGIPDYRMYGDKQGVFGSFWPKWRPVFAKHWPAVLAGTMSRRDAIARIISELY